MFLMMSSIIVLAGTSILPSSHGIPAEAPILPLGRVSLRDLANILQTLESGCLIGLVVRPLSKDRTGLISN